MNTKFTEKDVYDIDVFTRDRVIRAAWEDDVSFESILIQYGYTETQVIKIMKTVMKPKMFIIWRERVQGRGEKHYKKMVTSNKSESEREY